MASIRIEDEARKDPRFVLLGKKMGTSKFDALGRMAEVWAYCTENQTYHAREEIIDACAEFDGFAKLILLPEIDLAEESSKGIRIRGTKGRIEWLKKLRDNGKKGGRPKVTRPKPDANQMETRAEPPSNPLTPTLAPAPVPKQESLYIAGALARMEIPEPDPASQERAEKDWLETCEKLGSPRTQCTYQERVEIRAALRRIGVDETRLALIGARFEAATPSFDPRKFINIRRCFDPDQIGKFQNLARPWIKKQREREGAA